MSYTIAITGKGGTGKTTVAGILVTRLIASGCSPVLAVDADPNTCLDEVLGVKAEYTVGQVREEAREIASKGMAAGMDKQTLLEMKIAESLVEADDFDLIAMGRCEGAGCYCYANNVLKQVINEISNNYPYVVIDNEAGLENLSRRIVQSVDLMVIVSDPSKRGMDTVRRLHLLAADMKVKYKKLAIVINRLRTETSPDAAKQLQRDTKADWLIDLPDDDKLAAIAQRGDSLLTVPDDNRVLKVLGEFLSEAIPESCKQITVN